MPRNLLITPLVEPTLDRVGFPLEHRYVEQVWLSIAGPSAVLFLRHCGRTLETEPAGARVDLVDLSRSLGLQPDTAPNWDARRISCARSIVWSSVERLPARVQALHHQLLTEHLQGPGRGGRDRTGRVDNIGGTAGRHRTHGATRTVTREASADERRDPVQLACRDSESHSRLRHRDHPSDHPSDSRRHSRLHSRLHREHQRSPQTHRLQVPRRGTCGAGRDEIGGRSHDHPSGPSPRATPQRSMTRSGQSAPLCETRRSTTMPSLVGMHPSFGRISNVHTDAPAMPAAAHVRERVQPRVQPQTIANRCPRERAPGR